MEVLWMLIWRIRLYTFTVENSSLIAPQCRICAQENGRSRCNRKSHSPPVIFKKNGNVDISVDLKRLKEAVVRETFIFLTLEEFLSTIAKIAFLFKSVTSSGFQGILLTDGSASADLHDSTKRNDIVMCTHCSGCCSGWYLLNQLRNIMKPSRMSWIEWVNQGSNLIGKMSFPPSANWILGMDNI